MSDDDNRQPVRQEDMDVTVFRGVPFSPNGDMNGMMYQPPQNENNLFFKLLCPQSITGLIIGRGGSIINQLNASTGARIKLSQNNEFFPETTDRILIVNGSREGIANALRELVTRISEAADKKPNSGAPPQIDMYGNPLVAANRGPQGTYQIKILIPKTASASIIGRSGVVIRRMAEVSNCKIQLGNENDPFNTKERIVTLNSAAVPNLVLGTQTIMFQLLEDSRHRSYFHLTTNYASPGPAMGPGGGPMMSSGPGGPNSNNNGGESYHNGGGNGNMNDYGNGGNNNDGNGNNAGGNYGGNMNYGGNRDRERMNGGGGGGGRMGNQNLQGGFRGSPMTPPPSMQMPPPPPLQISPMMMGMNQMNAMNSMNGINPMNPMNAPPYAIHMPGQYLGFPPPASSPMPLPPNHPLAQNPNQPGLYQMMSSQQMQPPHFAMGPPMNGPPMNGNGPQMFGYGGPQLLEHHQQPSHQHQHQQPSMHYNIPPGTMMSSNGMYGPGPGPANGNGASNGGPNAASVSAGPKK